MYCNQPQGESSAKYQGITVLFFLLLSFSLKASPDKIVNPFKREFINSYVDHCLNSNQNEEVTNSLCECEAYGIYEEFSLLELFRLETEVQPDSLTSDNRMQRIRKVTNSCKKESNQVKGKKKELDEK